jgi:hypothetical protein
MANPTRPAVSLPATTTTTAPPEQAAIVEAAAEVVPAPGADVEAFNAARRARFITTTGDAPISNGPTNLGKLNAKTLAEHAAGKQALAQYAPAE